MNAEKWFAANHDLTWSTTYTPTLSRKRTVGLHKNIDIIYGFIVRPRLRYRLFSSPVIQSGTLYGPGSTIESLATERIQKCELPNLDTDKMKKKKKKYQADRYNIEEASTSIYPMGVHKKAYLIANATKVSLKMNINKIIGKQAQLFIIV